MGALWGRVAVPLLLTPFAVPLLPKEFSLFGRQPEKELKREQSLDQLREESLEGRAKALEKELEQEQMHLPQAKERFQQLQEEMRQQQQEEAEQLRQQKEESLRYFPSDSSSPCSPPSLS